MKRTLSIFAVVLCFGVLALLIHGQRQSTATRAAKPRPAESVTKQVPVVGMTPPSVSAQGAPAPHVPDREMMASGWQTSPRADLAAFAAWVNRYLAASADRAAMVADGVQLAKARRVMMKQLIQSDPREALANTLPVKVRNQLPQEVQNLLEERISKRGDLFLVRGIAPPDVKNVVPAIDQANVDGRVFQAHRYGDRALTPAFRDISIHGIAVDDQMAVLDSPVRKMEEGETAAEITENCVVTNNVKVIPPTDVKEKEEKETPVLLVGDHGYTMCCPFCSEDFETRMERLERQALGADGSVSAIEADSKNPRGLSSSGVNGSADYPGKPPYTLTHSANTMILMRVDFPDHTGNAFSEATLRDKIDGTDGVNQMVTRFSKGVSTVASPTITPVLRMPHDSTYYNSGSYWGDILNDANAAATALGYNPGSFSCRVIIHDIVLKDSGAAGWGGGGAIWCNNNIEKRLFIHEYGHVFWLPHANSWTSTDGNPLSDSRAHVEYGDASDPMGNAWGTSAYSDYNAYYKNILGWIPDSSIVAVSHSGTYRINQFDGNYDTSKPLALKITRDNNLDLWVMFRGDGVPQGNYNTGAYIVGVSGERFGDSHVIDMNDPSGNTDNAPLAQGQTWTDTASGISITTAGRMMTDAPHHLYVKVTFPPGYTQGYRPLVNGGVYALRNVSFNKYLDVPNNSTADGTSLQLFTYNGSAAQQYVAMRNTDGTYNLRHFGTTKNVDVANNSGANYANVIQWDYTTGNADAQKWDILYTPDGYIKFRHRGTDELLCADTANNGDIIQYVDFNGAEQKWEPVLLGINDGTYRLVPRHAQGMTIGLRGRSGAVGTNVEQQNWAGGEWQGWTLQSVGSGQFRIYPQNKPGVTLAIAGASTADGAKAVLETYTGASSQKFTFTATGMGFVRISPVHAPAMALDINQSGTAAGIDLQQYTYTGGNNQQWRFIDSNL